MAKKAIPTSDFNTNQLIADWHGADKLKAHYSLIRVRHTKDDRWSTLMNSIRKADLKEVLGWTTYEDDQVKPVRWYILLVAPVNRDTYLQRVLQQNNELQGNSYADPTQCPFWQVVMLRLFVNSLRYTGDGNRQYTLYGHLLVINPQNFGVKPCEEDQLLGLTMEVTKSGCLVSHTRTFTKTDKPLEGKLAKKELYQLDAASYKMAPVLRSEPFEKGKEYYYLYNRNKDKHNIIPQFVFSDGKKLNCKLRLMSLAMDAINELFKEFVTVRYNNVAYAPRVNYPYFDRMIQTVHAALTGKTITIEDTVKDELSERYSQQIKQTIQSGDYYNNQTSKRYKKPILTWVEPNEPAELIIRLVPPADKDNKETQKYLALFQDERHPTTARPYQHVQLINHQQNFVKKVHNVMPRILTELAIKQMLVDHQLTNLPQLSFLRGWVVGVIRHADNKGNQIGGLMQISTQGDLTFYMIGDLLIEHQSTIQAMGGELLLMQPEEINELFEDQRIGGKGPFYLFQQPGKPTMSLIEAGEFAMPNTANIDAFFKRIVTEPVCSCEEVDEAMRAVNIQTIPPYRERLHLTNQVTAAQLEQISMMLKAAKVDDKVRLRFRDQLPGLRRSQIKNLSNIEVMFGALTDIHYWMEGDVCKYVSTQNTNLQAITPTTEIVRLPHVRSISYTAQPGYFHTPEGKACLEQFMESLTLGFGRSGDGSVYPMPFKLLEEWMDQVLLSTLGKHWSAISSRQKEESEEQPTEKPATPKERTAPNAE